MIVQCTLAELAERLMASYRCAGGINHVDGRNLPSKHGVAEITIDLLRLLFPGFFDEKPLHTSEIEGITMALLDSVLRRLESEIRKSLEYVAPSGKAESELPALARAKTLGFAGQTVSGAGDAVTD